MTQYIQKLHNENKEDDLVVFMQQSFSDFDVTYRYETEHAGYFAFNKNGKPKVGFIICNFNCYPFDMDDEIKKIGLDKQVRKTYLRFMKNNFEDYEQDYYQAKKEAEELSI